MPEARAKREAQERAGRLRIFQKELAELESLGFDCAAALRDPTHPPLPRPASEARQTLFDEQSTALRFPVKTTLRSKLVAVDAARTADPLRQKYSVSNTAAAELHYTVTLSYGSGFEPWVVTE